MNLEIAKYRKDNKEEFLESCSANWLSELTNRATFLDFSEKHQLPQKGRELFMEVDYEQMSGTRNPNLSDPSHSIIYLEALSALYKSESFNFQKLFNADTGKPIKETRVFIQGKMVNLTLEYYNGFTVEQFFKLKQLNYNSENLAIFEVIDNYDNGEHSIEQGEQISIEIRVMNQYEQNRSEIEKCIEFVKIAKDEGNRIQLMTS